MRAWDFDPDDTCMYRGSRRKRRKPVKLMERRKPVKLTETRNISVRIQTTVVSPFACLCCSALLCAPLICLLPLFSPPSVSIVARVGHIYLEGPLIDRYGSEPHPLVDDACRANRAARDGVHYHATLVHGSLVERLRKERPPCLGAAKEPTGDDDAAGAYSFESELVDFFALRLTTPVREFGLGRATSGQHTAYYRVLQWAQLNDLRGELGLPPVDLHVTVGFKMQDVHGVAKNRWTLCEERRKK